VPDAPDVWLISERDATFDLSSDPEAAAAKIKILSDEAEAELNGQIADYVALMTKIVAALKENGYSVSFECPIIPSNLFQYPLFLFFIFLSKTISHFLW
jgi:hypothetical protein